MTTYPFTKAGRGVVGLAVVLLAAGLGAGGVHAQARWLQTVELLTPVKDDYVTGALLDTLAAALEHTPEKLKRTPANGEALTYEALESALLSDGIDFTSATHLFIGYRLEANQRRFTSDITHFYFIYRPQEIDGIDIPILYLDGSDPVLRDVLTNSGTPLRYNEAALQPFGEQLTFHKLPEGTVVSVGGRVIRDPAEAAAEKQRLLETIRRFLFN